jgi:hypothetical protein
LRVRLVRQKPQTLRKQIQDFFPRTLEGLQPHPHPDPRQPHAPRPCILCRTKCFGVCALTIAVSMSTSGPLRWAAASLCVRRCTTTTTSCRLQQAPGSRPWACTRPPGCCSSTTWETLQLSRSSSSRRATRRRHRRVCRACSATLFLLLQWPLAQLRAGSAC